MHCESAATFRPRDSGGGGPLELAKRANRGGGGAGRGASLSVQKILCAGRSERAKMSGDHQNSCVALSPAPPPPPCFAGWSPSPAIAGAENGHILSKRLALPLRIFALSSSLSGTVCIHSSAGGFMTNG